MKTNQINTQRNFALRLKTVNGDYQDIMAENKNFSKKIRGSVWFFLNIIYICSARYIKINKPHEVINLKKAETNGLGRHTGESPAVHSRLHIDVSCSDLPYFVKSNFFIMHDTVENCAIRTEAQQQIAGKIVNKILRFDDPQSIRDNLRDMLDAFILYYDAPEYEYKEAIFATYHVLSEALKDMEPLTEGRAL